MGTEPRRRPRWRGHATITAAALLTVGCIEVEVPEAPASLDAQLDAAGVGATRAASDTDEASIDATVAEPPVAAESAEPATVDHSGPDDAAVAAADARCAEVYARAEELEVTLMQEVWAIMTGDAPAPEQDMVADAIETSLAMTEDLVVAVEDAGREDPRLDAIGQRLRTEVLPFYVEFAPLLVYGEVGAAEDFLAREGAPVFAAASELDRLGFRHCFQPQSLL